MYSVLSKKTYKNAILLWLFLSFIFTVPLFGQDRGVTCSTPDPSYAQTESFTAVLKNRKAKNRGAAKQYVDYNLPVHLYIIADEEGNLPQTSSFPYESAEQITEIFKSSLQSVSKECHYFGLLHTNYGSANRDENGEIGPSLYPDHTPVPNCHPDPDRDCGGLEPGECFGDRIADTPVDYMSKECRAEFFEGDGSVFGSNCPVSCPVMVNDEEVVYLRDYSNAMDFTWAYQARVALTPGQKERVYETLVDTTEGSHPFAYGYNEGLGDMTIDILTSYRGRATTIPFPYGRVNTMYHPVTSFGDLALGKGVFETDFALAELGLFNDEKDGVSIGFYSFSGLGNYCEGDANTDSYFPYKKASYEISVLDHILTLRHTLGIEEFGSPFQHLTADMNYDGRISVMDLREMSKAVLNDRYNHDYVYNWLFFPKSNLLDSTFQEQFNDDPFGAELMHNGERLSYLPNENNETYIGKKSSSKSNRSSLYYPFSDPRISDIDTWSFLALKYGNVNMSYDGTVERSGSFLEEQIAEEKIKLTYQRGKGTTRTRFGVKNAKGDILGVRYRIEVAPGMDVKLKGIVPTNKSTGSEDDYVYSQVSEDLIEVIWVPARGVNQADALDLFDVEVQQAPGGSQKSQDLLVSGEIVYLNEEGTRKAEEQLSFPVAETVAPEKTSTLEARYQVSPNPTSSDVSIFLPGEELNVSEGCVLNLYDVRGYGVRINAHLDHGRIEVSEAQLNRLAAGLILFRTEFRGKTYSGKFMKR